MALYVSETSSQMEGCSDNAIDLSKFSTVMEALKSLEMFESYFSTFTQNNVHDEALLCLEKDDVKDLIPKIGDRARFMNWLNVYKNKNTNEMKETSKPIKQPCLVCNGNKQVKITEPYTENIPCVACGGQGGSRGRWETSTCGSCNGTGYTSYYSMHCPDGCGKKGPNTCVWCSGSPHKQRECETCRGKKTQQRFDSNFWNVCNACGGQANMKQNKTRDKWVTCTTCNGQ
eukprot:233514_1